ncbi:MAG: putative toxin-antitoxin system toxin component, PIN family [Desulfamplus sp.]|nr:putative toxin-antitoxin system toxin component, PIN family [Desulfamplus sp.]
MMKVIIDTNILISALLRDRMPETVILWIITQPEWIWIASPAIIQEYQEVLRRKKFNFSSTLIQQWIDLIYETVVITESSLTLDFQRDRKDAKFLECAQSSGADVFITGDQDFSEAQQLLETRILNLTDFARLFL